MRRTRQPDQPATRPHSCSGGQGVGESARDDVWTCGGSTGERGSGGLAGEREVFGRQGQGAVSMCCSARSRRTFTPRQSTRARAAGLASARSRSTAGATTGEGGREGGREVVEVWIF